MVDTDNFESFLEEMLENEDLSSAQKTAQAVEVKPESQPETQSELQPAAKEKKSEITKRNPFKFLDAYTPDDLDIFFGRDMEIAELYHTAFSHKVSVVFGNSGAGKTSLVQCGFLSRVKPEKAAFFPIRSAIDPLSSLKTECISKICIYDDESDLFTNLTLAAQTLKKTMILFFDQFEEIFILQPLETRRQLAILLKKIIHSDLDIKIIMGIREEYFARLIEFEKVIPDILSNRIWVRNMSGMQAEKVIVNPCQVCGVEIEPDVPKQVIAELSQGKEGVELPYVQVVMDNLFGRAVERDPDHPHIRSADFTIQGGVKNILSNFIEDQIKDMSDVEKTKQVLKSLITSEGTKRILNIGGIADASSNYGEAIELAMLQEILRELVTRRILREDPDNALYELRHDTLAFTILKWMSGIEQELMEVRQTLENRFREYQARNTLLDASALGYIAPYESRLRLKPEMLDFIEKSKKEAAKKRRRILTAVGVAVAVFVLAVSVLGGFGYLKSIEATNQSIEANKQAKEAITQKAFAEAKLIEARHNMGLVYNEKAERAIENKNFNAGRLYALHALNSFDLELAGEEKSKAIGMVLSHPDYPIIFSTPDGSHHDGAGMSVSFSPDGKTLASGFWDKTIRLWDVETGKEKSLLSGHTDYVWSVCFSPDGKTLASGSWDKTIRLWDVETGKEKSLLSGHTNTVNSVCFSPDGKTLASGSREKTIRLWDVETGKEKSLLSGHTDYVWSVCFSPDGKTLASGSGDNTIRLWDVETGKEKSQLSGHTDAVMSVSFSPDGKTLASGSDDRTIRLWDVETGKEKSLLSGHTDYVWSVCFSPDGKTLASGSRDKTIRLWDVETGKEKSLLSGHTDRVWSVSFSPDGKTLASGYWNNPIRLWDVETGKEKFQLSGHTNTVNSVSFSPDGKTLASGSGDKTIRLWNVKTGKEKFQLSGHTNTVDSVSFSPDGKTLASGSGDNTICLWDVQTGKEKSQLPGHTSSVTSVSFSPDGKTLASGSGDNTICLWDVQTGKEKSQLPGHTSSVTSVSFSPDGKTLASGSGDNTIRLWDVETGKEKSQLPGHTAYVNSVSFSPDGKTLASGSGDKTIRLWDVETGKEKSLLPGHTSYVNSVSFSPDGKTLASGSRDKTIRLWDVETGKEKSQLPGHTSYVNSVSFSPDGKTLASGSDDNTIRLWDLTFYFKVKDRQVNEAEIKKAEQQYNLHLVKLEMQPILEERNLYRIKPQLPDWPQTHPFHWLAKAEAGDSDAMLELGFIYDRDNNMDKAEYWYRRSAKSGHREVEERLKRLEISKAEVFYNSGVEFHNSGQFDKAIENYTQAIALNSEHADAYWNRSNIYGNQKKYDLAIPDLRKINLLASDFADAYGQLGWFLIMQGKYEEAKAPCLKAHELAPDSYACAVNVGHTYLLTGDAGKAREYYGKTIDLIKTEEEFTKGPMADFELFISNGWQVEACRQEMAWMKKAFKAAGSETHSHIDIN